MKALGVLLLLLLPLASRAADPLPPEKAFRFEAQLEGRERVNFRFDIAPGYYLYRDKFRFAPTADGLKLGPARLPQGAVKDDPNFGQVETYRDTLQFPLEIEASPAGAVTLSVTYQGCADIGICYPPQTQTVSLATSGAQKPPQDEASRLMALIRDAGFLAIVGAFFGAGLLLAFTPCVFPMIPILSGIIVGHGHAISKWRAFELSAIYVLGMAVTYAAAGVAAGLSGTLLSAALQNPWVLGGFAAIFVVLALAMFGLFELQLPTALQSRLSQASSHQRSGSAAGVLVMGVLSALIVGPCVAAPLAGALLYIAKTGDALLGGVALFAMALGMGAPLIAVGVTARHLLPHSGPWMEGVKKAFGLMLLALAVWLVAPVLPGQVVMFAWAGLAIFTGIFLRAIDPLPPHAKGPLRLAKAAGVIALLWGLALLAGALAGWQDPLRPLGFVSGAVRHESAVQFERVRSVAELEARLKTADRPVMLDFYADWCIACKEMERETFPHPEVQARLANFILLQADVTANNAQDVELLRRFDLFGPPGIVFFRAGGEEIPGTRVIGFEPAEAFITSLGKAL